MPLKRLYSVGPGRMDDAFAGSNSASGTNEQQAPMLTAQEPSNLGRTTTGQHQNPDGSIEVWTCGNMGAGRINLMRARVEVDGRTTEMPSMTIRGDQLPPRLQAEMAAKIGLVIPREPVGVPQPPLQDQASRTEAQTRTAVHGQVRRAPPGDLGCEGDASASNNQVQRYVERINEHLLDWKLVQTDNTNHQPAVAAEQDHQSLSTTATISKHDADGNIFAFTFDRLGTDQVRVASSMLGVNGKLTELEPREYHIDSISRFLSSSQISRHLQAHLASKMGLASHDAPTHMSQVDTTQKPAETRSEDRSRDRGR